jgi:hypothetical protein
MERLVPKNYKLIQGFGEHDDLTCITIDFQALN